jgi:16S rRNA (adenine(1408)-N(1))-methyltransferase
VIVDLGAGDGRAVLARAAAEPRAIVIGIDANAAGMTESSRRAARGRPGRGATNAIFLAEAAEGLPGFLAETASLVTITMPWGSLLRGVVGLDQAALRGVASVVAPGGRVEVLASVLPADHVEGIEELDRSSQAGITEAWRAVGLELESMRRATIEDVRATRSSWARRLGDRPVWRIDLRRS